MLKDMHCRSGENHTQYSDYTGDFWIGWHSEDLLPILFGIPCSSMFFTSQMHPNASKCSIKKDRESMGSLASGLDHKWLDLCFWQFPVSTHGSASTPKLLHLSAAATSHVAPGPHPPNAPMPKHAKALRLFLLFTDMS